MTLPFYCLFLAAVCFTIRGLFGIAAVIDDCKVGPRNDRVQQPSRFRTANGLASAEGNEAGSGAINVGAGGSCPRNGLTSGEPPRADIYDWETEGVA